MKQKFGISSDKSKGWGHEAARSSQLGRQDGFPEGEERLVVHANPNLA
jgi:hypothetical protein